MIALTLTLLAVLAGDQRSSSWFAASSGPIRFHSGHSEACGSCRDELWLRRLGGQSSAATIWVLWVAAAGALVMISSVAPSSQVFAGLLLGGSLSNALESALRGSVTDYVCLRFWPTFNLADAGFDRRSHRHGHRLLMALRGSGA